MKKSMLAMSVAAAIGGLGFAGAALAITTPGGATADSLELNTNGIGHQLVVPYFSTQSGNATLLNIVNTDTVHGKLVKVRFRGAGNSDDLYDFQVLMSPGDVWTAAVTQGEDGASVLSTADKSCAIGLGNGKFSTLRTDPTKTNAETREGYVEFLNMADIPSGSDLYTAIKHVNGVAPCTASVLAAALGTDVADVTAAGLRGLTPPSTGLTGDWILLNQTTTAAWSGAAAALEARDSTTGLPALGNVVFWPQKFGDVAPADAYTADPLLVGTAPIVAPQQYDLPDLSTPYVVGDTPALRADGTTAQLAVTSVSNQFETSEGILAVTDWLFSQPTRRYHVAVDYSAGTAGAAVYRNVTGTNHYNTDNTGLYARQICLDTTFGPGRNSLFDREETTPGVTDSPFVPSPNLPEQAEILLLCGEANVVSINADGVTAPSALGATVARGDISTDYVNGWARWDLNNGSYGVPVLGASFMRAANGTVNYGFAFPHKTTRAVAP